MERYGSFVEAHAKIGADVANERANNLAVGETFKQTTEAETINWVARMKANSAAWHSASPERQAELANENEWIATTKLAELIPGLHRGSDGVWYMPDGRKLYDVYHEGGVVGHNVSLRQDEMMAVLQKGELVLTKQQQSVMGDAITFMESLRDRISGAMQNARAPSIFGTSAARDLLNAAGEAGGETNVHFGDVYITGTDKDNIAKYREVNREFVNDVVKVLNLRR